MKRRTIFTFILLACLITPRVCAQHIAVKSNVLYDATSTLNLGLEFGWAKKWTLDVPVNVNPWKFNDGTRLRHWGIQPEVRYWFCEKFRRTFVGVHGHYADYNVGNWSNLSFVSNNMQQNRYQGHLYGGGISIGHAWIIKKRWGIEASLGLGYARLVYDKYPCGECGTRIKENSKNYWGPTRASVSLIYLLK